MWPEPSSSLAISCSSRSARPRKRPDGSLPWLTSNCRKTINRSAPRPSPTACPRTSCGKRAPCSSQGQACEGRYLLRTNLSGKDPALLWRLYIQLTEIEQAFKELKGDLAIRPIYHQHDHRIEAHIFVAFVAYCLQVTLKQRLRALAPGLTPRAVLEKLKTLQMLDVHLPTTDGRHIVLPRYTQPDKDQQLLLQQLKLKLPPQPPPRISTASS